MSIELKLEGFDDLLNQIQKAGGTIDSAAAQCMRESADIMHSELQKQMQAANVDSGLIGRMPAPEVEIKNNVYKARVGYQKGAYNPKNPSDAYKVIFINFGTPRRTKHGKIKARRFIQKAKKNAKSAIKKTQKETLEKILGGLKGEKKVN